MRIKAVSDEYIEHAKRIRRKGLIPDVFIVVAMVFLLLHMYLNKTGYSPFNAFAPVGVTLILILVYHGTMRQTNICAHIGESRYITFGEEKLILEDVENDAKILREYAWRDIKHIVIKNAAPFKFIRRERKTYTVTFVLDEHAYVQSDADFTGSKRLKYIDQLFMVMQTPEVMDTIAQHWHGEVKEELFQGIKCVARPIPRNNL